MTPLRQERERRKFTATNVAKGIGTTQSHYSKIENGKTVASADLARRIARFFGNAVTEHQVLYPGDYAVPERIPELKAS